jgi:hypothetical protein
MLTSACSRAIHRESGKRTPLAILCVARTESIPIAGTAMCGPFNTRESTDSQGGHTTMHFSTYFVMSTLRTMDYPRKKSFLGKPGVPGLVLRGAVVQLAQASVAIGAGRPRLACQLLTQYFRSRDWQTQSGDDLFSELDPRSVVGDHVEESPWEALMHSDGSRYDDEFITIREIERQDALCLWLGRSAEALIYGLVHFDCATKALESDLLRYKSTASEWISAGLNIPEVPIWPGVESYFQWVQQTVEAFESEHGRLPEPPAQLMASTVVRSRLR